MKWILFNKKKPKKGQCVLCYQNNDYAPILTLWFNRGKFVDMGDDGNLINPDDAFYPDILYWAELPKPPQTKNK